MPPAFGGLGEAVLADVAGTTPQASAAPLARVGARRELAANMIVTDGVMAGETESFPLLYHWRVLRVRPPVAAEHEDLDAVVAALDGSPAVRVRLEALAVASWSLVLCREYIPYPARVGPRGSGR